MQSKPYNNGKVYKKILVLPDMHAPWVNWPAIKQAYKWYKKHKPELVVCLGDITDQKIWSKWPKDVDDYSPCEEFERAEKILIKLHQMFPKMIILRGNHDVRILKAAVEAGIPSRMFNDVDQVFAYKGWEWWSKDKKLIINTKRGPILFVHGDEDGGTIVQKSRIASMSMIQGHTHKTSITYTNGPRGHFFGAEMGCLMDIPSKASKYAESNTIGVSIGFGVVKYGIPYFIDYTPGITIG